MYTPGDYNEYHRSAYEKPYYGLINPVWWKEQIRPHADRLSIVGNLLQSTRPAIGAAYALGNTYYNIYKKRQAAERQQQELAKQATKQQYYAIKGEHLLQDIENMNRQIIPYEKQTSIYTDPYRDLDQQVSELEQQLSIIPDSEPSARNNSELLASYEPEIIEDIEERRRSPKGKSPERRQSMPFIKPGPGFLDFEVSPGKMLKDNFIGTTRNNDNATANVILAKMRQQGYYAVMNDPDILAQKQYRKLLKLFTNEGLSAAIENPKRYIPDAIKTIVSDRVLGKLNNPRGYTKGERKEKHERSRKRRNIGALTDNPQHKQTLSILPGIISKSKGNGSLLLKNRM